MSLPPKGVNAELQSGLLKPLPAMYDLVMTMAETYKHHITIPGAFVKITWDHDVTPVLWFGWSGKIAGNEYDFGERVDAFQLLRTQNTQQAKDLADAIGQRVSQRLRQVHPNNEQEF